jgi:hypothetical protein
MANGEYVEFVVPINPRELVACPFCDQLNSPAAKVCAHCRSALEGNAEWENNVEGYRNFLRVCFLLVVLLLVGGGIFALLDNPGKPEAPAAAVSSSPFHAGTILITTAVRVNVNGQEYLTKPGTSVYAFAEAGDLLKVRFGPAEVEIPKVATNYRGAEPVQSRGTGSWMWRRRDDPLAAPPKHDPY